MFIEFMIVKDPHTKDKCSRRINNYNNHNIQKRQ